MQAKIEAGGSVDRSLTASPRLDDAINRSLSVDGRGRVFFHPQVDRLARIANKIAYGLFTLHYGHRQSIARFRPIWIGPLNAEDIPAPIVAAQFHWPGIRRKPWKVVQQNVFKFLFAKGWMVGDPPIYCLMIFHDTLLCAVGCPQDNGKSATKLPQKRW